MSGKEVILPGELVSKDRKKLGGNVFIENGKIYSEAVGLVDKEREEASVVALEGRYIPKTTDLVVGIVVSETHSGYLVDINSIYTSYISKDDLRDRLQRGSIISAKVKSVDEVNEADLIEPRVFYGGEILSISPVKVPRLIGKNGSMLAQLKDGTSCNVLVGRNGWIWAKGGNTALLRQAVEMIESEAHKSNLTNRVADFLKNNRGKIDG